MSDTNTHSHMYFMIKLHKITKYENLTHPLRLLIIVFQMQRRFCASPGKDYGSQEILADDVWMGNLGSWKKKMQIIYFSIAIFYGRWVSIFNCHFIINFIFILFIFSNGLHVLDDGVFGTK